MLPTPTRRRWSMISFLIAARVPRSRSAKAAAVKPGSSGAGPGRASYALQAVSSSSHTVPRRRTSRYTNRRPSSRPQVSTAYRASAALKVSYTIRLPVMRGWMTRRCPERRRITACLARRSTPRIVFPVSVRSRRGLETRRSTSAVLRVARRMRRPVRRGASWRAMDSTSGSSGTLDLAPPNVAAVDPAVEADALASREADLRGGRHVWSEARDAEFPAARDAQHAVVVAGRARVEDQHVG